MRNLKFALVAIIASTMFIACGSNRNVPTSAVAGGVVVENLPFSSPEYFTDDTHWRGRGTAMSAQLAMGRRVATQNARTLLAQEISSQVRAVATNYANHESVEMDTEEASRFQEGVRIATDVTLNDARVIGEQVLRLPDGRLEVHVVVEMSRDAVIQGITNRISADDRLRLRFDEYQFRRIFEEEMRVIQRR